MTQSERRIARRRFILGAAVGTVAVPLLGREAFAASKPKLDPSSPTASALHYSEDATKSQRPSPDQSCASCMQFTAVGDGSWGDCTIFPGNVVSHNGWCSAYVKKK